MKNLLSSISKANNHLLKELCIDDALNFCISDIGLGQDIDRCYIFKNKIEDGVLKLFYSYEWCNSDIDSYIGNPDLNGIFYDDLPGLYSKLSIDEPMFGLVKDSTNKFFKSVMEMQGIKSYLFTPIFSDNSFWGWIGYDDCKTERKWIDEEVYALHTIAKNIGLRLNQDRTVLRLQATLEKFDLYMATSNQAMWEWDLDTNKTIYSHNWAGMLGLSDDEIIHDQDFWKKSIYPEDLNKLLLEIDLLVQNKLDNHSGTIRMIHKTGKIIWVKYDILQKKNNEGKPLKLIGTHIDISELKEKEHQLQLSEEKFRFIAENSKDLICQHGNDGNFIYVSCSSLEILGYTPEELMNKSPRDFIHKNDLRNIQKYYQTIIRNQENVVLTFRFRNKNGTYIWVETTTKIILDCESNVIGFQTSNRDISERIKADKEIKAALIKEKKFHDLKSKFVTMASHQFRTPLTVIYSNSELLDLKISHFDKKVTDDFRHITSRIKNEVDRMTELMDNILIFGKYESKRIEKRIQPFDFNDFVTTLICTYFDNDSYNRKINVETKGMKKKFFTDETLMIHILTNLISNAFKYSVGKSNPLLSITYLEKEIEIEVIDYGIGIPQKEIQYLFTSFFRASNTSTIIGSGLGLAIVKQFTEFLNGTIELKTKENRGTTVKLTFPYEQK